MLRVIWCADELGYRVEAINEGGQPVYTYAVGNNQFDSAPEATVSPDDPAALPLLTIRCYARITANEVALDFQTFEVKEDPELLQREPV